MDNSFGLGLSGEDGLKKVTEDNMATEGMKVSLILPMIMAGMNPMFKSMAVLVALMIFFLGATLVIVLKLLNQKKIAAFTLLGIGLLSTIFLLIPMFESFKLYGVFGSVAKLTNSPITGGDAFGVASMIVFPLILMTIAFGLIPLVKGIHKTMASLR